MSSASFQLNAGNEIMETYGQETLTLILVHRHAFTWQFCATDVSLPILGADLLKCYGL